MTTPMKSETTKVEQLPRKAPGEESKRERFLRLGEKRMQRVLKGYRLLGQLGNRSSYEFTDTDVQKMIGKLNDAQSKLVSRMQDHRQQEEFSFR